MDSGFLRRDGEDGAVCEVNRRSTIAGGFLVDDRLDDGGSIGVVVVCGVGCSVGTSTPLGLGKTDTSARLLITWLASSSDVNFSLLLLLLVVVLLVVLLVVAVVVVVLFISWFIKNGFLCFLYESWEWRMGGGKAGRWVRLLDE